jgi:Amt family ammonium transporter
MLVPTPKWLDTGSNAWQMAAATFVGLQSVPGLTILYGGIVKRKWAVNSAFMAVYAFAAVLIVWVLWAYNMAFGPQMFPFWGVPKSALSAAFLEGQATIPALAATGGIPPLGFPMATMMFFQFVFAAITVIILGGSLIGRMSFKAWIIFVPLWMTFVYTVGAFSLWGGGWLAQWGALDFSGGYVIHLAAGVSGFVAAAVIGPRIQQDRDHFPPNSLLMALAGAGILWLGWNGFNGGDPYFANADAAAALLNTNLTTAVALLVWTIMDSMAYGKPSVVGAINGMIAGLVGITPAAGYVNGWGAIIIGICAGIIPWFFMNKVQTSALFRRVDDTLSVLSTHGVAGLMGGLLTGILANPDMLEYIGTDKDAPGVSGTGWLYGNFHQFLLQIYAAAFIIVLNIVATYAILKVISIFVALRMDEATLRVGDDAVHGETAYNFGDGEEIPAVAE